MHRAKHRAARRVSAGSDTAVLATTLVERLATVPSARTEHARPVPGATGPAPYGPAPRVAPVLPVPSPFGAARHAAPPRPRGTAVPGPRVIQAPPPAGRPRTHPVGATLSVTVLGAAAAVSAVVAPPATPIETTPAPVQGTATAPAPAVTADLPATPQAPADLPTLEVGALVTEVTGEMRGVERPYTTVASKKAALSPAATRRAALSNALGKLGKPYRWGATGPHAFDCSGLVKWSFGNAGRSLPRTSRALASVGVPVRKKDLQPGDIVLFYKPVSHVGIYIGNGKVVHASRKGQPVKITDLSRMQFNSARRV